MPQARHDERQPVDQAVWQPWIRGVVSLAIAAHLVAVVAAALAAPPSSPLERAVADQFVRYYELIDQGHTHRYYVDPPPTPVVTAHVRFADGRPEKVVRIPDRALRPRLRYQRHLALAYHLFMDHRRAQQAAAGAAEGGEPASLWARSYARHLCRENPGCAGVTLFVQMHLVPDLERLGEAALRPGGGPIDVDSAEFFTVPERIGDFPCDGL